MKVEDFLNEVKVAVILADMNFKIKYANSYALHLLGLTHGNILNRSILEFHTPDARSKIQKIYKDRIVHPDNYPVIQVWEGPDNTFLLWAKLSRLFDEDGNLAFLMAIFYDLSKFTLREEFTSSADQNIKLERIPIYENRKIKLLDIDSINFIKSEGNYSIICREDGKTFVSTLHLNMLENKLPQPQFMRVHRSYIVNIKRIEEIILEEGGKYRLKLPCTCMGERIYISRRKYNEFRKLLMLS